MPKPTFFNLPDEKRELITECAIDEFAQRGYEKSSINRIVDAAGIAKGSFYQYFEDKFDLYEHIVNIGIAGPKLDNIDMAHSVAVMEKLDFFDLLRMLFRENVKKVSRDPRILKIGIDLAADRHSEAYQRIMGGYADLYNSFYYQFIEAKKARGEIHSEVNSWLLNYMLLGLTDYVFDWVLKQGPAIFATNYTDRIVDDIERILSHGIFTEKQP